MKRPDQGVLIKKLKLTQHIFRKSFPCIMAKAVAKKNRIFKKEVDFKSISVANIHSWFVKHLYEKKVLNKNKLASFSLEFNNVPENLIESFNEFEGFFWNLLAELTTIDEAKYQYDKRVSADPYNKKFSFSIAGEAFFVILLHPNNPRISRRTHIPYIIFNPHSQFETLRLKGTFTKIRNLIRKRDKLLQGFINPMMKDYQDSPEALQYSGREYKNISKCPLHKLIRRKA